MASSSTTSPGPQVAIELVQESAAPLHAGVGHGGYTVEVDNGNDIDESSEYSTTTTSLASSVFSFTYANGRRYHSDRFKSEYFMPNDEREQQRLDLYHHIFLLLLGGKLYTAPLDNPQRVLDVGTGTGIWAIDFADENPQAEIFGPDISPIQPNWVPPNCRFEVDDMEEPWTYPNDYFDYVHIRSLSGSFKDWGKVLKEAYKKTKPGGYIEFQDYSCQTFLSNGTRLTGVNDEHPVASYMHYIMVAFEKRGMILDVAPLAKKLLEEAGFVDVVEKTAIWPIGHWPKDKRLKEIGRFARTGSEESLYPFGVSILKSQGWTTEQVLDMCHKVKESYKVDQPGSLVGKYYFQGWFVYGRKPEVE